VNSEGNTLEFQLSATRDAEAAKRLFSQTLHVSHTIVPWVITVDKNAAYPKALKELKAEGTIPEGCELRQVNYLDNIVEQDHRFIKRLVKPGLGFFSLETAWRTLQGDARDTHDSQETNARASKGRHHRADCVHRSPVWSSGLKGDKRSCLSLGFLHEFLQQNRGRCRWCPFSL
jgi:transposase-like protein